MMFEQLDVCLKKLIIWIWKEGFKVSLFSDVRIPYTRDPQRLHQETPGANKHCCKVVGYGIKITCSLLRYQWQIVWERSQGNSPMHTTKQTNKTRKTQPTSSNPQHVCTGWFSVSTWHRLELSQRKELQLGKCLHEIQLWGIFSISDQVGRPLVGGAITGLVVLGSIREQSEQSRGKQGIK